MNLIIFSSERHDEIMSRAESAAVKKPSVEAKTLKFVRLLHFI